MPPIKIIDAKTKILTPLTPERCSEIMKILEYAGRTCYQSEPKGDPDKFINGIVKRGHESVLEHQSITIEFITDRGTTHEVVRHRVAAYSQESTRYVNYSDGAEFILPIEYTYASCMTSGDFDAISKRKEVWRALCQNSADAYSTLREIGAKPEEARNVLDNSLKTSIIATWNMRELRHLLKLRCAKPAHPHIKQIMIPLLMYLKEKLPVLFSDIEYDTEFYNKYKMYLSTVVKENFITGDIDDEEESMEAKRDITHERLREICDTAHQYFDYITNPKYKEEKSDTSEKENSDVQPDQDTNKEEDATPWFHSESMDIHEFGELPDVDLEKTPDTPVVNTEKKFEKTVKQDKELKKKILEKCGEKEATSNKYLVKLRLHGTYHYRYDFHGNTIKTLVECESSLRVSVQSSDVPVSIVPFKCDGDTIELQATIITEGSAVKASELAKRIFNKILIVNNKEEYIPYVMRMNTFGHSF